MVFTTVVKALRIGGDFFLTTCMDWCFAILSVFLEFLVLKIIFFCLNLPCSN